MTLSWKHKQAKALLPLTSCLYNKVTSVLLSVLIHVIRIRCCEFPECEVSCDLCSTRGSPTWTCKWLGTHRNWRSSCASLRGHFIAAPAESDLTKTKGRMNSFRKFLGLRVVNAVFSLFFQLRFARISGDRTWLCAGPRLCGGGVCFRDVITCVHPPWGLPRGVLYRTVESWYLLKSFKNIFD